MRIHHRVLQRGRNCWRIETAERAAFIVDVAPYFGAVRESLLRAEHSIIIVGWDIHSRIEFIGENHSDDGYPLTLGALLDALAKRRGVNIYILNWDYALIYAFEREPLTSYELGSLTDPRVHYWTDGYHPRGASQHQKIVVIDDRVAFCGGIDLGKWRWDTPEHRVDDQRRIDPEGKSYPPFHDIQMVVDGAAAKSLAELARNRWLVATQGKIKPAGRCRHDVWPASVDVELADVKVAIARTQPGYKQQREIFEVRQLYLDSIAAARRFIYIENQYLTSECIGQAIAARLQESDGPEIVIVQPERTGGWLEQHTMDVLRWRVLRQISQADRHDHLRVYYVRLSQEPPVSLMVHSKVMIIDDVLVRVGSSNLSNRSMGFDTECDLFVEAEPESHESKAIGAFRERLLGEHLAKTPAQIRAAMQHESSLIKAIESLRGGIRTLEVLDAEVDPAIDQWVPEALLLDPEHPLDTEKLVNHIVPREHQPHTFRRVAMATSMLVLLIGLVAVWRWTEFGRAIDLEALIHQAEILNSQPFTPLLVIGIFTLAGMLAVPLTLLVLACVLAFGPFVGFAYSLAGAELSAIVTYALSSGLAHDLVRRYAGRRLNQLSEKLSRRGLLTIITLRVIPVAPYVVINLLAGASHIRFKDFALGTLIGLLPGILAISLFTDRVAESIREPGGGNLFLLAGVLLILVVGMVWLRRWLHARNSAVTASSGGEIR